MQSTAPRTPPPVMQSNRVPITLPTTLLILLVALLLPSFAAAYTIYFNDGSNMITRGPYIVQGDRVLVTMPSGTETRFALSEIDQEKTLRQNKGNLRGVVVIDANGTRAFTPGESRQRSPRTLQDAIREGKSKARTRNITAEATQANTSPSRRIPLTKTGFPDLQRSMREPLTDTNLEADLNASLRAMGVAKFRLYAGSREEHLMVEITTRGRTEVFEQLEALSKGFSLAADTSPFTGLEVLMLNERRSRAGQFLLSGENVPLLTKGIMTPQEFFLQYVQF